MEQCGLKALVPKPWCTFELHREAVLKHKLLGPTPRVSDTLGLGGL
jgi:hypothetical protein